MKGLNHPVGRFPIRTKLSIVTAGLASIPPFLFFVFIFMVRSGELKALSLNNQERKAIAIREELAAALKTESGSATGSGMLKTSPGPVWKGYNRRRRLKVGFSLRRETSVFLCSSEKPGAPRVPDPAAESYPGQTKSWPPAKAAAPITGC